MQLEKLNIALAPGSAGWVALDLGFALGRHWFWRLFAAWAAVAVPVLLLSGLLLMHSLWLAMLVLWWFKPAFEQLPLFVLSRAIFNEPPPARELRAVARRWIPRQLFANLTWRRFSASRSFNAPVAQLEELRSKARRARLQVLYEGHGARTWLTVAGAHFESLFYGSLLVVGYALVPEELALRDTLINTQMLVDGAQLLCYFLAMALMAPFYVAAGFSLYLHRRAQLEAWDIELVFRRLGARVGGAAGARPVAGILVLGFALALGAVSIGPRAEAAEGPVARSEARQAITEVLQDKDFGEKKTVSSWRLKPGEAKKKADGEPPTWPALIARLGEILLWVLAAVLIVYVLFRLPEWLARLPRRRAPRRVRPGPTVLFGMDVRAESLPDDVGAEALALAERGQVRAALGLLYRASLAVLMDRERIEFHESFTEGECLRLVQAARPGPGAEFFRRLTGDWQRAAYGHLPPAPEAVRELCNAWSRHFGEPA